MMGNQKLIDEIISKMVHVEVLNELQLERGHSDLRATTIGQVLFEIEGKLGEYRSRVCR